MVRRIFKKRGNFIAAGVLCLTLVFLINTGMQAYAQAQHKNEIKKDESFQRPEPSRPISPEIPGVNRYQEDKVFLEYADSLYKINNRRDTIERQILKGNVKFRQAGLWMFCDSAYYYPEENSLDAFSNVRMEQGDTLFVYADKLFYNGDLHLAKLKNGPTRDKVTLINKDVTLTTDSLDYDISLDVGWYTKWGTIDDKVNTLTSLYGQYSPKTKLAEFFTDVVLVNQKDGFTMLTDTLYYSTETHIANIESRTEIRSENDTIFTNLATYYTDSGNADLLSRSLIIHRDSTGNVTTLEGDSIIYDNATRISRAYMFQDPFKRSTPMVITDTAQKTTLIGGFGIYNDSTKEALATIYPLLMEYSQGDTLFLRADTIKTFIVTEMVAGKRIRRVTESGFPENEGFPIVMPDSLGKGIWIDTTFFKVRIPYVETPLVMLLKAAPPYQEPPMVQATQVEEIGEAEEIIPIIETIEAMASSVEERDTISTVENNNLLLDTLEANDSIVLLDKISLLDSISLSDSINFTDSINVTDSVNIPDSALNIVEVNPEIPLYDSIPKESHVVLAYHRGRFFKQDMQGVADSIVFVERDSMLYLFRKPIVWSEERQVTGNRIDVHFNDSTTDWAYLPEFGLMSEHVDEDFYNQIFGKEITAYFEGQGLRKMEVSGNVETIFLPQESDSTFNRLVNAESSYMEVYMNKNQLDWLKMWPEVSGTVTPIFLVKRNQMYLPKFKWWGFLRPQREWYGDRVRWADNLGEVPEDLEKYFLEPSDFGEPKSFTGSRIIVPPSSLPSVLNVAPSDSIDALDYLYMQSDSIPGIDTSLQVPDSVQTGVDSPGVINAEKSEDLGEIIENNIDEEEDAKDIEEQSEDIEEQISDEFGSGIIKEESAIKEEEEGEGNNE